MAKVSASTQTGSSKVRSYKIVKTGAGKAEVTVTSGTFAGKSARIITTSPSAAYFSNAPARRASSSKT